MEHILDECVHGTQQHDGILQERKEGEGEEGEGERGGRERREREGRGGKERRGREEEESTV